MGSVPDEHRRLSMGLPMGETIEDPSMLMGSMDCFCSACPCLPAALAKFVGAMMETLMAMMASMGGSLVGGATSVSVGTSPGTDLATIQEEMAKKQEEMAKKLQ